MLNKDDETWYWDPNTNIVERRANKRIKKSKKDKKAKEQDNQKSDNQEKKIKSKKLIQAARSNRKTLTASDDICWRKAQINRNNSQREESCITLGNPAEAIEQALGIKLSPPSSKRKLKTHPLNHSISFSSVFRRNKGSSSSSISSSESSESESEEPVKTTHTISKLRLMPLRLKKSSRSSSSSASSTQSSNTTSSTQDSTQSIGSTSSSTNTSPVTTPRSSTGSPATTPRANLYTPRARLQMGLRGSSQNCGSPRSPSCPSSPNSIMDENGDQNKGIAGIRARVPPLVLDSSEDELELQSIEEPTDDSLSAERRFWVREPVYSPPIIRIPSTPYFDMILRSFDDCL